MFKSPTIYLLCLCGCLLWGDVISGQTDSSLTGINFPVNASPAFSQGIRKVPDSLVSAYHQSPAFSYANDPAYWKEAAAEDPGWSQRIFDFLMGKAFRIPFFILLLALMLYGVYRLVKENSFTWFTRSRAPAQHAGSTNENGGLDGHGLEEAIRKQTEIGNYRMATRYMYLKIIRTLSEKKEAGFRLSATNADMLRAFQDPEQAGDFRLLATAYEYIFYGGFTPNREQFDLLQIKFDLFYQKLKN